MMGETIFQVALTLGDGGLIPSYQRLTTFSTFTW